MPVDAVASAVASCTASSFVEGYDTHPCCDRPGSTGSYTVPEHTAQLLGAMLLAQPA